VHCAITAFEPIHTSFFYTPPFPTIIIHCSVILVQVRLQASATGTRYTGIIDAVTNIVRVDGVTGLWRGVVPTVQRAAVLTAAQVTSSQNYRQIPKFSPYRVTSAQLL
jgi:hypothetical protein